MAPVIGQLSPNYTTQVARMARAHGKLYATRFFSSIYRQSCHSIGI